MRGRATPHASCLIAHAFVTASPAPGEAPEATGRGFLDQLEDHHQRIGMRRDNLAVRERATNVLPATELFIGQAQGDLVSAGAGAWHGNLRIGVRTNPRPR